MSIVEQGHEFFIELNTQLQHYKLKQSILSMIHKFLDCGKHWRAALYTPQVCHHCNAK